MPVQNTTVIHECSLVSRVDGGIVWCLAWGQPAFSWACDPTVISCRRSQLKCQAGPETHETRETTKTEIQCKKKMKFTVLGSCYLLNGPICSTDSTCVDGRCCSSSEGATKPREACCKLGTSNSNLNFAVLCNASFRPFAALGSASQVPVVI